VSASVVPLGTPIAEHAILPPWALIAYLASGVLFILALRVF